MPYCRMARVLTQFQRKYTVLNHIGFNSPYPKVYHKILYIGIQIYFAFFVDFDIWLQ